jgi:hypothetical protein
MKYLELVRWTLDVSVVANLTLSIYPPAEPSFFNTVRLVNEQYGTHSSEYIVQFKS